VIIDESMIGNILNTNYEESSSFFSFKLILYLVILGILPSIFIIKANIIKGTPKNFDYLFTHFTIYAYPGICQCKQLAMD
jgi:glucan phosphoethanolaminetransferase (alkaline phosphatase superfamily)